MVVVEGELIFEEPANCEARTFDAHYIFAQGGKI